MHRKGDGLMSEAQEEARFFVASPEYHGVLREHGDNRLVIAANGGRYMWQVRSESGDYTVSRWRKRLGLLLPDLPASVADWAIVSLPDDPQEYPRPWAEEIEAGRARLLSANPERDEYAGVIRAGLDGLRLVFLPGRDAYAVQIKGALGWATLASSKSTSRLLASTVAALAQEDCNAPGARNGALQAALASVPEKASDFDGQPRKAAEDAQEARRAARRAAELRAAGGAADR